LDLAYSAYDIYLQVCSFGENDLLDVITIKPDTIIHSGQKALQRVFGYSLPVFWGRGIFNYDWVRHTTQKSTDIQHRRVLVDCLFISPIA
jgi:hypothetical protein